MSDKYIVIYDNESKDNIAIIHTNDNYRTIEDIKEIIWKYTEEWHTLDTGECLMEYIERRNKEVDLMKRVEIIRDFENMEYGG